MPANCCAWGSPTPPDACLEGQSASLACRRGNQVQRGEQGGRHERAGWVDPRGPAAWPHRCDLGKAWPLKARSPSTVSCCRGKQVTSTAQPSTPWGWGLRLRAEEYSGSFEKVCTRVGDRKPFSWSVHCCKPELTVAHGGRLWMPDPATPFQVKQHVCAPRLLPEST